MVHWAKEIVCIRTKELVCIRTKGLVWKIGLLLSKMGITDGKNIAVGKMGKLFLKIRIREDGQKSNCYFSVLNPSVFLSSLSFLFHV